MARCKTHPGVRLINIDGPGGKPTECPRCDADLDEEAAARRAPLWWDDASYIRYQIAGMDDDYRTPLELAAVEVTTPDYCDGEPADRLFAREHAEHCPQHRTNPWF